MNHAPELRVWVELLLALASGVAVIVVLAAIIARRLRLAAWQRTIWQVSTLGLALLLICELTGIARGVTGWSYERLTTPTAPPAAHAPAGLAPVEHTTERVDESGDARNLGAPAALRAFSHGSTETRPAVANSRDQSQDTSTNLDQVSLLPAWLWLVGSVVLLGRLLVGRLLLESFRWRHRAIDQSFLHERVQSTARRLGMSRRVRVVVVPELLGPIALGTLRPTIGLPENFTEQFDGGQQEAILAHELGHLAAYDCAWHTLADLVAATLWWHPLVWWCRHELRSTSEWAADEACLALPDGPESLAACLVKLGGQLSWRRPIGWMGIEGNGFRSSLGRRVERLLHMSDRQWPRPQRVSSSLVKIFGPAVMVTVALVSTGWSRSTEISQGETMFQSIRQSWRQSLAGLMFLGVVGNRDDSATLALEDSFDRNAVVKNDTEQDRPSVDDEDDDVDEERDKKSEKVKDDDVKDASLDRLYERLKQLEAENEKLRDALQAKDSGVLRKKGFEGEVGVKLPPKKTAIKSGDQDAKKVIEKGAESKEVLSAKLKEIQETVARLQKEGRGDEAEKMAGIARDLQRRLHDSAERDTIKFVPKGKEKKLDMPDFDKRIEQLKHEIEKSARAGQPDRVEALRQELEKTVQHAHHFPTKGFQKSDPAAPHELGAVIKELGEQVHQLRAEVEELRRLVKDRGGDKR